MTVIAASSTQPCLRSFTIRPNISQSAAGMSRMASISRKLEIGRRVLEGMGRVGVEEAAAVGAQLLDGDLAGGRPDGDGLLRHDGRVRGPERLDQLGDRIGTPRLHHALRHEQQGPHQRERQQHVERGAGQVDPEVADGALLRAGKAADQGHHHGDAGGRGHEVLHPERQRLGEVAHRALAAVGLPVGVGGEADGGVEREGRGSPRRTPRDCRGGSPWTPLQQVHHRKARGAEHEERRRVARPASSRRLQRRRPAGRARARAAVPGGSASVCSPDMTCAMNRPSGIARASSTAKYSDDLDPVVGRHDSDSGLSSAKTR